MEKYEVAGHEYTIDWERYNDGVTFRFYTQGLVDIGIGLPELQMYYRFDKDQVHTTYLNDITKNVPYILKKCVERIVINYNNASKLHPMESVEQVIRWLESKMIHVRGSHAESLRVDPKKFVLKDWQYKESSLAGYVTLVPVEIGYETYRKNYKGRWIVILKKPVEYTHIRNGASAGYEFLKQ